MLGVGTGSRGKLTGCEWNIALLFGREGVQLAVPQAAAAAPATTAAVENRLDKRKRRPNCVHLQRLRVNLKRTVLYLRPYYQSAFFFAVVVFAA